MNCTTRKQVEKILPEFVRRWPTPEKFIQTKIVDVASLIAPLGFQQKRAVRLFELTNFYLKNKWQDPRELPGIGEYGARAWEIFCKGELGNESPKDHALAQYYNWARKYRPNI